MREADVDRFQEQLMTRREDILAKLHQREDIVIVPCTDLIETIQLAGECELAVRALQRETELLTQIDAALERIDKGEFGVCVDCEEPISPKRLAAMPWAAYCLRCQEAHDAHATAAAVVAMLAA